MLALGLLVVGIAAGYLLGVPGNPTPPIAATTTTTVEVAAATAAEPLEVVDYAWTEQASPDRDPRLWAVHTAIEHDGAIYTLIVEDIDDRLSRALWRTADGAAWEQVSLDLGPDTVPTDLDVLDGDLLISGWDGDQPGLWRSTGSIQAPNISWRPVPLPSNRFPIGDLARVFSRVKTEVNAVGEVVVVADMLYAIDARSIPGTTDRWGNPIALDGRPSMTVTGTEIWTSAVSADGVETASMLTIPPAYSTRPVSGRAGLDVVEVHAWSMWTSPTGSSFRTVAPQSGSDLAPTVMSFEDGFVAAVPAWAKKRYGLLMSEDGTAWEAAPGAPPSECGNARPAVAGAGVLLLVSEDFDYTCTSADGEVWEVHPSPQTAVSQNAFVWVTGDGDRFLAVAVNSQERAFLESVDGIDWRRSSLTDGATGGSAHLVGERLLVVARTGGSRDERPWTVWVGEPTGA